MNGNVSRVVSLLSGLGVGTIFGVYLSQNYVVPDVKSVIGLIQDKADDYSKSNDGNSERKN